MALRASFYKYFRQLSVVTALTVFFVSGLKAQTSPEYIIPSEIKFADVTFQLNDVSKYLISKEIKNLTENKELKEKYIRRLALILPIIDPVLRKDGIPLDFRILSIYNRYQSSVSKTTVLDYNIWWCLDEKKALEVNLKVDNLVDERKHIVLATAKAAASIKRDYALYNNWGATLFSQLASRNVLNTLEISKKWRGTYLPLDAPAYNAVLDFLAFKLVIEHDFNSTMNLSPVVIYEYPYGEGRSLNAIAADLRVEPLSLIASNFWLKGTKVPESEGNVLVEVSSNKLYETKLLAEFSRNIGVSSPVELGFPIVKEAQNLAKGRGGLFYIINGKKGIQADMCDSFVTLAYKAGISIKKFLQYNDMTEKDMTTVGQIYYLEDKESKAFIPFHIARKGETFWDIAHKYGVKLSTILAYNREEKIVRLEPGRMIWLESERPKDRPIEIVEINEEQPIVEPEKKVDQSIAVEPLKLENTTIVEPIIEHDRAYADSVFNQRLKESEGEVTKIISKKDLQAVKDPEKVSKKLEVVFHEVQKGETLFDLAKNYGISVEQIYSLNNLKDSKLEEGEKLRLRSF